MESDLVKCNSEEASLRSDSFITSIKAELTLTPRDLHLHETLLKRYLSINEVKNAFDHAYNVEFRDKIFKNDLSWYKILHEILECDSDKNEGWLYQVLLLTVRERICSLNMSEKFKSTILPILTEDTEYLHAYDQAIYKVISLGPSPGLEMFHTAMLDHHKGQIALHSATFLLIKNGHKERPESAITSLMLIAWQQVPSNLRRNWLRHSPEKHILALNRWYIEGTYRCSQAGHYCLHLIKTLSLQSFRSNCLNTFHYDLYLYDKTAITSTKTTYFGSGAIGPHSHILPKQFEVEAYDKDAQKEYPRSLHHMVWTLLKYEKMADFECTLFDKLNFSSMDSEHTFNKLDIYAFLYCATLTARNNGNYISTLPANIKSILCSDVQAKWWDCAYEYYTNKVGSDLIGIDATFAYGITVIRCMGNNKLDPELLYNLGCIFSERAAKSTDIKETHQLKERASLYYQTALLFLQKLINTSVENVTQYRDITMFNYVCKDMNDKEVKHLLKECKIGIMKNNLTYGEYQTLYNLAHTYKRNALIFNDLKLKDKFTASLFEAKTLALKALNKILELEANINVLFYSDIQELIQEIEIDFKSLEINSTDLINTKYSENESIPATNSNLFTDFNSSWFEEYCKSMKKIIAFHFYILESSTNEVNDKIDKFKNVTADFQCLKRQITELEVRVFKNSSLVQTYIGRNPLPLPDLSTTSTVSSISVGTTRTTPATSENSFSVNLTNNEKISVIKSSIFLGNGNENTGIKELKSAGPIIPPIVTPMLPTVTSMAASSIPPPVTSVKSVDTKDTARSLPINVVITSSDPLPTCTSTPGPALSPKIPLRHIKETPHNYQIAMPSKNETNVYASPPVFVFPQNKTTTSTVTFANWLIPSVVKTTSINTTSTVQSVLQEALQYVPKISADTLNTSTACNSPKDPAKIKTSSTPVKQLDNTTKFNSGIPPSTANATAAVKSESTGQVLFKPNPVEHKESIFDPPTINDQKSNEEASIFDGTGAHKFNFRIPSNNYNNSEVSAAFGEKAFDIFGTRKIATDSAPIDFTVKKTNEQTTLAKPALLPTPQTDSATSYVINEDCKFNYVFKPKMSKSSIKSQLKDKGDDDSEYVAEDECNHSFTPVIPLPDKVEVVTGEENEIELYGNLAKLYRFHSSEWKERGKGIVKILKHKDTGKLRVVMRRDQVLKTCLNHLLSSEVNYTAKDEKSWLFTVNDFSEGALTLEHFCLRFKNKEIASQFKEVVDKVVQGGSLDTVNTKPTILTKGDSDDIIFVNEIQATQEEKQKSSALMLIPSSVNSLNNFSFGLSQSISIISDNTHMSTTNTGIYSNKSLFDNKKDTKDIEVKSITEDYDELENQLTSDNQGNIFELDATTNQSKFGVQPKPNTFGTDAIGGVSDIGPISSQNKAFESGNSLFDTPTPETTFNVASNSEMSKEESSINNPKEKNPEKSETVSFTALLSISDSGFDQSEKIPDCKWAGEPILITKKQSAPDGDKSQNDSATNDVAKSGNDEKYTPIVALPDRVVGTTEEKHKTSEVATCSSDRAS